MCDSLVGFDYTKHRVVSDPVWRNAGGSRLMAAFDFFLARVALRHGVEHGDLHQPALAFFIHVSVKSHTLGYSFGKLQNFLSQFFF